MNAIESLIPQNQIEPLKERLADYYLPAFSVDDTHAPEVFVISVYKRPYTDSTCAIIRITRQAIAVSNEVPDPPLGKAIADGDVDFAGGLELKPSYHTSSEIKDGTWEVQTKGPSADGVRFIETIACTKGWYDEAIAENRVINAKIFSKVIQDTFRVLSEEDRDKLKEKYDEVDLEIDDYVQVLASLDTIKAATIDKINSVPMALDSYFLQGPAAILRGTNGIPVMIRQAFYDISRLNERIAETSDSNARGAGNSSSVSLKRVCQGGDELEAPISGSPLEEGDDIGQVPLAETAYSNIMSKIKNTDDTDNVPFEELFVSDNIIGSNDDDSFDIELLKLRGRKIFGTSSENPWVNQWYFENVIKKMEDKDPNFDNLNVYIETLDEKISKLMRNFNYHVGKGGHLLAQQAMMRSILALCESNIDVSTYAPRQVGGQGRTIFDLIGKSSVLGPQGTVPYPNQLVDNDDPEKSPEPFSKTGFLCFHALLKELKKILSKGGNNDAEFAEYRTWLSNNLVTADSDHDFTLQLAHKIIDGEKSSSNLVDGLFLYRGSSSRRYTSGYDDKPKDAKEYVNLYKDEERVSWLPPKNRQEDTYFKWYKIGRNTEVLDNENVAGFPQLVSLFGGGFGTGRRSADGNTVSETSDAKEEATYDPSKEQNILMGFTEAGVVNRTARVHYGWPNLKYHDAQSGDVRGFFKNKAYSLPQIWGSSISILRSLAVGYVENMIDCYREITATDAELRAVDILSSMNTEDRNLILGLILDTVEMVDQDNEIEINFYINGDGSRSIYTTEDNSTSVTSSSSSYHNTSGKYLRNIAHDYLKFISKISTHSTLELVNSQTRRTIPYATFIPVEAHDNSANPNVVLKHYPDPADGIASTYFRPAQLEPYYDRLEWATNEFKKSLLINRGSSGIRQEEVPLDSGINASHRAFLRRHAIDFQHLDFLTKYASFLKDFQANLENLEIQQSVVKMFEDGVLDSDEKLGEPGLMVKQIRNRRQFYRANSFGVAERFAFENLPTASELRSVVSGAEYIYVLGLYEEAWTNTDKNNDSTIKIKCNYRNILGDETTEIAEYDVMYMEPTEAQGFELNSRRLLDYLHIVRGLDLREHAFSDHTDLIFEDDIVKNDSETFPWTKDDFEENKPLKPLDTIWSMSPWVFPRNYFHDTTSYHKYHRVIAVIIPKSTLLEAMSPQHDSDEIDLIGTLQWEIVNE